MRVWWLSLALLASAGAHAQAGKIVIYRCTDALGQLTVQNNTPCPKGSQQQKRVIEDAPASSAPPTFVTSPVAPYAPANAPPPHPPVSSQLPSVATPPGARPKPLPKPAGPTIADADRLPPPVLFECRTYDSSRYLSDDGKPPQRCATLQTTGLGSVGNGVGVACQMVDDQCQRIADDHLCENWKQRLREAESALRFGRSDGQDASAAEVARIRRIVTESTCGKTGA